MLAGVAQSEHDEPAAEEASTIAEELAKEQARIDAMDKRLLLGLRKEAERKRKRVEAMELLDEDSDGTFGEWHAYICMRWNKRRERSGAVAVAYDT